jgi:NADH-quinone oxidoreductase subunit L
LQGIAAVVALAGLAIVHFRYGKGRSKAFASAGKPATGMAAFLLNGWYVDSLYDFIFIKPYKALSPFLWQKVDEGLIDDSLDRLADGLGRTGAGLGRWTGGHVSLYIFSFAAGGALILGYLAWAVW